jgi:hypothetical protein
VNWNQVSNGVQNKGCTVSGKKKEKISVKLTRQYLIHTVSATGGPFLRKLHLNSSVVTAFIKAEKFTLTIIYEVITKTRHGVIAIS